MSLCEVVVFDDLTKSEGHVGRGTSVEKKKKNASIWLTRRDQGDSRNKA